MATVELLVIGNEVLAGQVLDTNSHWLCRQVSVGGASVRRITVLPDDPELIGEALMAALRRRPALIVSCGGLGPTADDLTVSAVAAALHRPLREDPQAYAQVRDFYALLHRRGHVNTAEMLPVRVKMAQLPEGATPLPNGTGAAPGVLLEEAETLIACLPGVPAELKDIWQNALWPRLAAQWAQQAYGERSVVTRCWDESLLAPIVDGVAERHPDVYVKSRAQVYGDGEADFVTLAARGADETAVAGLLDAAERDLRATLAGAGIETA